MHTANSLWKAYKLLEHVEYTFDIYLVGGNSNDWILEVTANDRPRLRLRYSSEKDCREEADTLMKLFGLMRMESEAT